MNSYWEIQTRFKGAKDWTPCTNHFAGEPNLQLLGRYQNQNPHKEFKIVHYKVTRTIYTGDEIVSDPV